ncbi:flagellar hook-associated protein FlgL [Kistimonas asteriae]|uniref:flagellar hook-associated protein FlgL n=1 Tax=Kistimonas asteriae TaxID=517724 RepID=UPI001BA890B1|nr:flagellar hook-associated protein FlgL [Kistimonas asteriae]
MRVSTVQFNNTMIASMQQQGSELAKTYDGITSGKRLQQPSDDALAAVQILHLNKEVAFLEQYSDNINALDNELRQEETLLTNMVNVLQGIRETVVLTGNVAVGPEGLKSMAGVIGEQLDELLSLVNYRRSDGQYFFSGTTSQTVPVAETATPGVYEYQGSEGQRLVSVSGTTDIAANDPGSDLFFNSGVQAATAVGTATLEDVNILDLQAFSLYDSISVENVAGTWTTTATPKDGGPAVLLPTTVTGDELTIAGVVSARIDGATAVGDRFTLTAVDTFTALATFSSDISSGGTFVPAEVLGDMLKTLDNTIDKVGQVQTRIGGRLNTMSSIGNSHEDVILMNQTLRSGLEDLDYAEAISRLNLQQTALSAAQQTFVKIQGMSLFDYMR